MADAYEDRPPEEGEMSRLLAPAKVNLTLAVTGLRPDGYHDLRTVMLALDIHDEVSVRVAGGTAGASTLTLEGPAVTEDLPADAANLALAGALAAGRLAGADTGFDVRLQKHLPSGAGLGGGSSDAAAAFLGAASLLGIDPHTAAARSALGACGSDCAFFAEARRSGVGLCEGRGEVVTALPAASPAWRVVVVTPQAHLATRDVYAARTGPLSGSGGPPSFPAQGLGASAEGARAFLYNQLEEAALRVSAELVAWRRCLDGLGLAHFRLAGSGASFFGLYDDDAEARAALEALLSAGAAEGLVTRFSAVARPWAAGGDNP